MKPITILQAGALCLLALYGASAANSSADAPAPCVANQPQPVCEKPLTD